MDKQISQTKKTDSKDANVNANEIKRRSNNFVPFDKMLEGLETEELHEEDQSTKLIKVQDRVTYTKYFLLEKVITNEMEQQKFLKDVSKFESLEHPGILCIIKWSFDMQLDGYMNRYFKFLILFEAVVANLDQYIESIQKSRGQIFKEDYILIFKNLISAINFLHEKKVTFNPIVPCTFALTMDNQIKFIAFPGFLTKTAIVRASKQLESFNAPEIVKKSKMIDLATSNVFSLGLVFIYLFTFKAPVKINEDPNITKQLVQEIQQKYGETYAKYIQAMVFFDNQKRMPIQVLSQAINAEETFCIVPTKSVQLQYSEGYEFFKNSGIVKENKPTTRTIVAFFPYTKRVCMANLFDKKKMFLEQLDLNIEGLIQEHSRCVVTDDGYIFLLGGLTSKETYLLEEQEPTLIKKSPMKAVDFRHSFGICYQENFIYVCGGFADNSEIPVKSVEKYDIKKDTWIELPQMKKAVVSPNLVKYNESLLKFGGAVNGKVQNVLEKYDFKQNQWKEIEFHMSKNLKQFSLLYSSFPIQINSNQIMVLGGWEQKGQINTRILYLNIDRAYNIEKGQDVDYHEFGYSDQLFLPENSGPIESVQISQNELFLIQKKDDRTRFLIYYNHEEGFKELKKIAF